MLYDYALLKLKERVETADFIKLSGDYSRVADKETSVLICGYPASRYKQLSLTENKLEVYQWGRSRPGKVIAIRP